MFKQVLYHYLANAVRRSPAGGRVTVRVRPEDGDAVRVEVEDRGGEPPDSAGETGLALAADLVAALGGRVGVGGGPGGGAILFAVLPRAADLMGLARSGAPSHAEDPAP
jgi:signal transduction histidine kinase